MRYEFVPWPNFADRMLNELNSGEKHLMFSLEIANGLVQVQFTVIM